MGDNYTVGYRRGMQAQSGALLKGEPSRVLATAPYLCPFSRLEKALLFFIAITAFVPYPFNAVIDLLEIACILFVVLSPILGLVIRQNIACFLVLSYSVVIGQLLGTSGLAEPTATLAFLKICVYLCFIIILAKRCANDENATFLLKYIVMPISAIMCVSVWIDLFTDTRFFADWQLRFVIYSGALEWFDTTSPASLLAAVEYFNRGSGFAARPWHVPAWAMCGLIGLMALKTRKEIRNNQFWLLLSLLIITPLLMPEAKALVTIGSAIIVYLLLLDRHELGTSKVKAVAAAVAVLLIFVALHPILEDLLAGQDIVFSTRKWLQLLSFTGDLRSVDPRVDMFTRDWQWLLRNPWILVLGSGWNFILTPSVKSHSLYISLLGGGGLVGLITLLLFLRKQVAEQLALRSAERHSSAISKAGLVSLALTGIADSYLTSRLNVPAAFLTLWITLCVIAAPVSAEENPSGAGLLQEDV